MLTTILVEHLWMTTAGLVGIVVLGPLVGAVLVGRPRTTWGLLGVSVLAVALLTLVPTSRELTVGCTVEWMLPRLRGVEGMANVLLLAPVAVLATVATRRPVRVLLVLSGASALVETVQALVPALGRSCSTNDWFTNTLGAALGVLLGLAALWLAQAVARRRAASGDSAQA